MKKVIERLESAKHAVLNCSLSTAVSCIEEIIAELQSPPRRHSEEDRRVRCNWCMSVFDEEHIKVIDDEEYCPICGETGYLMDMPEAESKPRWETPEQYEKRTGEAWPNDWAVYALTELGWIAMSYKLAKMKSHYDDGFLGFVTAIVCAAEAGSPPDGWEPEEEG